MSYGSTTGQMFAQSKQHVVMQKFDSYLFKQLQSSICRPFPPSMCKFGKNLQRFCPGLINVQVWQIFFRDKSLHIITTGYGRVTPNSLPFHTGTQSSESKGEKALLAIGYLYVLLPSHLTSVTFHIQYVFYINACLAIGYNLVAG